MIAMSGKLIFASAVVVASLLQARMGFAEDAPSPHKGPWPIHNGRNYQPTELELRALHRADVTTDQARKIDQLYDQLLSEQPRDRRSVSSR